MRRDKHSFNLADFFKLLQKEKERLVFKDFELVGNYDEHKYLRNDIDSLSSLMRMTNKLSIRGVSFGKKVDSIVPYNAVINLPSSSPLESLSLDKSPFYLRKSESSQLLAVKDLKFEYSILDGMMTWFDLSQLRSLDLIYC